MELRDAITQITQIRSQMARTERLRALRAVPVAISGVLALIAALTQHAWLLDPQNNFSAYLTLWVGAATLSAILAGVEMTVRCRMADSSLNRATSLLAVEHFAPCLVAGALVTCIVPATAPESAWMLPGLWQILFGLGLFASHRLLAQPALLVAAFYLISGSLCLTMGPAALEPWAMGVPFCVGQLATAAVLYWTVERAEAAEQKQSERLS